MGSSSYPRACTAGNRRRRQARAARRSPGRCGIPAAEAEIDKLRRQLKILGDRHYDIIKDALLEHADTVGQDYVRLIAALQEKLKTLFGASMVLRHHQEFTDPFALPECEIALPRFGLPSVPGPRYAQMRDGTRLEPVIRVTPREADDTAGPWHQLAELWTRDPRAAPPKE